MRNTRWRQFSVIENDIDVHAIWRIAQGCGFTDIRMALPVLQSPRGAAGRFRPDRGWPPIDAGFTRCDAKHRRFQLQPADFCTRQGRRCFLMLFYEPLFLFLFFPIVFTAYLAVRPWAGVRAAGAAGGEPVLLFVERTAFCPGGAADLRRRLPLGPAGGARPEGGARDRGDDQSRHPRVLQIHRVRGGQPRRAAGRRRAGPLASGPGGAADRRFVHRVREDHLPGRHRPRPQPPGAGFHDLPPVCVPVPEAARRPDHQISRAGGAAVGRDGRNRAADLAEGCGASCWAWSRRPSSPTRWPRAPT